MTYSYTKSYKQKKKPIVVMFSYISVFIGTLVLLWSFFPIILFQLNQVFAAVHVSPVDKKNLASPLRQGLSIYDDRLEPYYSTYLRDFTKVQDWFPQSPQSLTKRKQITDYTIDVPRINLVGSKVIVGGEALDKSLVQYGNAVYPGEVGNTVILGHSTLPQLYKEDDYKSVFTYLPSLERGDEVKVHINGFSYTFVVFDMFTVDPSDTWVLDGKAEESVLTLITCVPPGTFWKRLIVRARLSGI
ncbi:MAG: sortase [Candidatus Roizmanbacteria bacterium]|nr:sortase [Candidatus Roizmanbacteria bacterium]